MSANLSVFCQRARDHAAKGRLEEALAIYDDVIASDPTYAPGYADRGTVRGMARRYQPALDDLRHAVSLGYAEPTLYNTMATILADMGMRHRALEVFAEAEALDATYPFTYFNRAATHEKMGDKAAARRDLETCLGFEGDERFKSTVQKRLAALA